MLQTIRDKFTGWIAIVFIGLLSMTLVISFGNMDQTPLQDDVVITVNGDCLLYTSPSPRDVEESRMPSSA